MPDAMTYQSRNNDTKCKEKFLCVCVSALLGKHSTVLTVLLCVLLLFRETKHPEQKVPPIDVMIYLLDVL
jgi:hypothetical protein